MFGEEFETVVGKGDIAVKSHFYKDLVCKIQIENRYVVAWARPINGTEYYEESKTGFKTHSPRQSALTCDPETSANLNRELFAQTINPYFLNKYVSIGDRASNMASVWIY
jgi:hypothetical protein